MAKGCYIGIGNVAQEVPKGYIGVNGVARKIKKAYIGDENSKAREFWTSLEIVSWADGTDEQIVAMVEAADRGEINLADYWTVGDTRAVALSAMANSGIKDWDDVEDSHEAQTAEFVLMNAGGYELNEAVANGRTECSFVVGMKDCLKTSGSINSTGSNTGSWDGSERRNWCNSIFRNAIPSTLRPIFKQFKTITAEEYNANTTTTSIDYFALPAAGEVLGEETSLSNKVEKAAVDSFEWYMTSANRIKQKDGSNTFWWTRSPYRGESNKFIRIVNNGEENDLNASAPLGLSPFGCI